MAGLFSTPPLPPIPAPPPAPSISDDRVQQAATQAVKKASQREGKASTYLTDPRTQRTAETNQQRYLGGF
jgi:hypothetical protein